MWFFLYNFLNVLVSPVILMMLMVKKRTRRGLWSRLSLRLPDANLTNAPVIWIHAVSLGEAVAIVPFIHAIHQRFPRAKIMVSTITETGREVVQDRLEGLAQHCYFPLDWPWVLNRFVKRLRPVVFIVVETELWPNVLRYLWKQGVPTILVNGRISSRSFQRYLWIRSFMTQVLSYLSLALVQSDRDRDRLVTLGLSPERIHCTGNMKFDQVFPAAGQFADCSVNALKGENSDEQWIIAGSTHFEEEIILLRIFHEISGVKPSVKLVLAPRHIERAGKLEQVVRDMGLPVVRRTQIGKSGKISGARVVILDSRGELAHLYKLASLAFVGGTLIPVGGHNLLEPARWAKPVVFGPYTDHCQEIATLLLEAGGGVQVKTENDLLAALLRGLEDHAWRDRVGQAAKTVVSKNQGMVERNLNLMSGFIENRLQSSL